MALNVFAFVGRVKTEPIFLTSKSTGNSFVKFTVCIDGDMPYAAQKELEAKGEKSESNWGQVYIDCLSFVSNRKNKPGGYVLANVHRGDIISAKGRICSGRKPVKEENDQYRANWVYGDYLYARIETIQVILRNKYKTQNPYNNDDTEKKKIKYHNQVKSADQYVDEDDLKFNI